MKYKQSRANRASQSASRADRRNTGQPELNLILLCKHNGSELTKHTTLGLESFTIEQAQQCNRREEKNPIASVKGWRYSCLSVLHVRTNGYMIPMKLL